MGSRDITHDRVSSTERFAAMPLSEPGTPLEAWVGAAANLPALEIKHWRGAVLVVAHPDDEVLGTGQLLAELSRRGVPVEVIIVSNGEAADPNASAQARSQLAQVRARESTTAAQVLRLQAPRFLGMPDGGLADYIEPIAQAVTDAIERAVAAGAKGDDRSEHPGETVGLISHWGLDGHPDHEAVSHAARVAFAALGERVSEVQHLEFPVWALHWDTPDNGMLRMHTAVRVSSGAATRALTREAAGCFVSQLESRDAGAPVLPAHVVQRLIERPQFILAEPSRQPVDSLDHLTRLYERERDPWRFETSDYEAQKRAATLAALPRERYEFCFEPGCSIGVLTLELAQRAERVLGWDAVERAVQQAQDRVASGEAAGTLHQGAVEIERNVLTTSGGDSHLGPFGADLIVLSEVLYFIPHDELAAVLAGIVERAHSGAHIVAVHWRHPVAGWPGGGSDTHRVVHEVAGLTHVHRDDESNDYLIDVWEVT